ncbi:hypothetical protein ACOMCU_01135 [Lysinibacillus sp. UGB7]|uniref:hypothetical protein n=1 Tax=Lysinibacillus sp. UGB7 TaxID=3411039 RepID=UPI003B816CAB
MKENVQKRMMKMHIELTRTTGTILKINVLSIDAVESDGNGGFFSSKNTSISIGSSTFYVIESYSEVSTKIDEALAKIPTELVVAKYKNNQIL